MNRMAISVASIKTERVILKVIQAKSSTKFNRDITFLICEK